MPRHLTAVRWVLLAFGVINTLTGLALLFLPEWFFANIGNYPPYNRHFLGDAGAFVLALGVGLLWAARNPAQDRGVIAVAALGSLLHVLNHVIDDVLSADASLTRVLANTLPLAIQATVLIWAWWAAKAEPTTAAGKI